MADPIQSEFEDEPLRKQLNSLDRDAAPVDARLLARLRKATLRELSKTDMTEEGTQTETQIAVVDPPRVTLRRGDSQMRGQGMLTLATRAVVSVTALVVGGFAWFFGGLDAEADSTLGKVLDETRKAKTLQLKVVRDGDLADVWMHEDGRLRYEASPTSYQIADGTSLWEIDEEANVARRSNDALLASAASDGDLLALLGVGKNSSSILRKAKPIGTVKHDGTQCRLYRVTTTVAERKLMFEAFVDKRTGELRSIAAWPAGLKKREGPPLAEVRLVARNVEVKKGQFEWKTSLSEDGRIGKIADRQGIVLLRPKLNRRWTPICNQMRLKPGDQIRTDVRGANAVAARLTSGATITVGPGTLVELTSPTVLRLHYGEAQIVGGKTGDVQVQGPMQETVRPDKDDATLYLVGRDRGLQIIQKKPVWLLGFEGASTNESIGSLITRVDGRDVPLTIGYHKVKVEIRDQIARTTIEESFVNRTKSRLEGIFHFPLPQDASISGFGMWIGGELVEADVVEKQRAREIYETILRERRDPGLLEWAGGNIFKARVFPIEAHSEKRIKIVYTQVLPLRANQYRYSYALRSEMLQKTPLRELSIDVLVNSTLPLKKIHSPTHPVRVEQSKRSASVQFSAQEYSPTRDFELVCDIDGRTSDVVTIPHRRGNDGYFMLQLMPPSVEGNWQREILPDGEPLEVLLVCDTSGSMDKANRKTQAEFVASVLSSLSPDDRFNMAVCDAETKWLFKKSVSPDEAKVDQARTWLGDRLSLGWTDLDATFESIQKRVGKKTHVVYVGDGVVSARDVNALEFAARVRRLYGKKPRGTFHAVSTGSSFESVVLKAIASLGRGSVRSIGSGQTPMSIALELLNEIAQPGLRDLNVEFKGVQVAAVYPEELPNLAAGTQQILIGRYLPTGEDQSGEIVVTGTRGGEKVRYSAKIPLKDAEKGNSFIPRLWARAHLDQLLQQGSSQFIQDEIIGLSEEFHIITPYTSLLVLETDEDRERFGVKRRFEMRDGERFFADGRDSANYELLQKIIREAGNWRLGLRHQILRQLARLGRNTQAVQEMKQLAQNVERVVAQSMPVSGSRSSSRYGWLDSNGEINGVTGTGGFANEEIWGGGFGGGGGSIGGYGGIQYSSPDGAMLPGLSGSLEKALGESKSESGRWGGETDAAESLDGLTLMDLTLMDFEGDEQGFIDEFQSPFELTARPNQGRYGGDRGRISDSRKAESSEPFTGLGAFAPGEKSNRALSRLQANKPASFGRYYYNNTPNYVSWLNTLFPSLPAPPKKAADLEKKKIEWPDDAVALSRSLLQNEWLTKFKGGLEIRVSADTHDPRWKRQTGHSENIELYSKNAWLTWSLTPGRGRTINWSDKKERGSISETFSLGRVRKSEPEDRRSSIGSGYYTFGAGLHEAYAEHKVEIVREGGITRLLITYKDSPTLQQRVSIDTEKHVVVKVEMLSEGKVTSATAYSDFVEIQGAWWPRRVESVDAEGRVTSTSTATFTELKDDAFEKRHGEELAVREQIQFFHHPVPTIEEAETAEADGSADFEDRMVLIVRSSQIQKWDEVLKQLDELEKLVGDKAGKHWIRMEILRAARRNAEVLDLIVAEAARLAEAQPADQERAQHLLNAMSSIGDHNESFKLQSQLKPIYDRQPDYSTANWTWKSHRIRSLRNLSRMEEVLALEKTQAEQSPWMIATQTQYARDLAESGNHKAAYAWLKKTLARSEYTRPERDSAWRTWADMLQQEGESAAQIEIVEQWLEDEPENEQPYSRYLVSLSFDDRMDKVREVVLKWMADGRIEGRLSDADRAKTGAAINYAMGNGRNIYSYVVLPEWYEPLQTTALYFMKHEHHFDFCSRIMDSYQFSNTDAADVVRVRMFEELQKNAATLDRHQLYAYTRWVRGGRPDEIVDDWKPIVEVLRKRWEGLKHTGESDDEKYSIGNTLSSIYQSLFRDSEYFPFLRERIARANDVRHDQYVLNLFDVLMAEPWTDDVEVELFGLLKEISKNTPASQVATQVEAAHRLVDRLLLARVEANQKVLQDTGHPEKLTRQELAAKKSEFQKAAQEGIAARLAEESKKDDGLLGKWLQMDRMFLDVRLARNLEEVSAECVVFLDEKPPVPDDDKQADENATRDELAKQASEDVIRAALRQRALMTYANLAVRKSAKPELQKWLFAYIDAGIETGKGNAATWKHMKYSLLVALDKPRELERIVRKWIQTDEYVTTWRWLLGRLAAERGELDEAIGLFEKIEKDSQLAPADYRALANWYLARDEKAKYKRARVEALKATQENQLSNFVRQGRYRWNRSDQPLPSELDEQVLFAFQALFEKSSSPGNYLYELKEFYRASRDFRLLQMIPDSVVGRTPQQVYSFLGQLWRTVLEEIRKEATADEILARIEELRKGELTTIDLRALDLLEALIERQSADVLNQPGPHIQAAVEALKRAFERDWADGEGRQMAQLLHSMGHLKQAELAADQLRQLEELYRRETAGTDDRLFCGWYLADVKFGSYGKRDEGLKQMEIVIREYEQAHPGGWPSQANTPFSGYVGMFEQLSRHAEAENIVKKQLEHSLNKGQKHWLTERLIAVYSSALSKDTRVSLGEKEELYLNLIPFVINHARKGDDNHRYRVLMEFRSVFRTAKRKNFPTLRKDLRKFAFTTLPKFLKRQRNNYSSMVDQWAYLLHVLVDSRMGLEFLIERIENYPRRLLYSWESPWSQFGYRIGDWRQTVGAGLGDLEPRLLALVLAELRRDLESRKHYNRYLYRKHSQFWEAKAADFAKTAEDVLAKHKDSARSMKYIAEYFWNGLERRGRAIEIMFVALKDGLLDDNGQARLVDWLHDDQVKRYAESIAILEGLIERHPLTMHYRHELITAYHRTARGTQRDELLEETDKLFRDGGRWTEDNLSQLAWCMHKNALHEETIKYYDELIPMHQRNHPTRGIGEGTLSVYYMWLADAHSNLKHTREAVDAAAAAIVAWGPRHDQRTSAFNKLASVLRNAEDLDDYVAHLDAKAEESGQDSSIIRRAIGNAYFRSGKHKKAIAQLRISIELQPGDLDTHQLLIKSFVALKDNAGAVQQILDLIDIDRHNLGLYSQLEEKLRDNEELAERAATAVVEASPNEAEHHEALAKIRDRQKQYDKAIVHWQQVAELRSLEPNGLINLAKAQLLGDQAAAARKTMDQVQKTEWPSRFDSDIQNAVKEFDRLRQAP
jgi:hypothetical protein